MKNIDIDFPTTGNKTIQYDETTDSVISFTGAKLANAEDIAREQDDGYTNPNLHRRIDPQEPDTLHSGELAPRDYQLGILDVNSYRTTTKYFHDDECPGDVVHYREIEQLDGSKIRVPIELP